MEMVKRLEQILIGRQIQGTVEMPYQFTPWIEGHEKYLYRIVRRGGKYA